MGKIYEPLDDPKTADLPEMTLPFWKIAGPGAILVGLSIGAGEIVIWPRIDLGPSRSARRSVGRARAYHFLASRCSNALQHTTRFS